MKINENEENKTGAAVVTASIPDGAGTTGSTIVMAEKNDLQPL